jgi:putative transposase
MSWTSQDLSQRRLNLVRGLLNGSLSVKEAGLQWSLSRKSIYKWLDRYRCMGPAGLMDRSRAPHQQRRLRTSELYALLLKLKGRYRTWGARKLLIFLPAHTYSLRTVERALADTGLTTRRKRRALPGPRKLKPFHLTIPLRPNEVWTVDFKGWFRTADGIRCNPLTVRDLYSRFGLALYLLPKPNEIHVRRAFVRLFQRFGLPKVIRIDNGPPFAGVHSTSPYGWSALSLWWSRLGIEVQLTRPAKPQDNGSHEQFHAVYQAEVAKHACPNPRVLQRRSKRWLDCYNFLRPHQALGGKRPADLYRPSRRKYRPVQLKPTYPKSWKKVRVTAKGYIRHQGRVRLLSRILAGLLIGLRPVNPECWEVYIDSILVGTLHLKDLAGMRPASYAQPKKVSPI